MSAPEDEMKVLLQRLLEKQTFSVEAAEGIAKLREQNATLNQRLEYANARVKDQGQDVTRLESALEKATKELQELRSRESKIVEHEKAVAVANARAETMKEMAGLIFRNTEIRRNMSGLAAPATSANPNYYPPQNVPVSETHTTTEG